MNEIQKYIAANESRIMEDLFSLIRIPSISALPEHHDDMLACAERLAQLLLEAGADEALVMPSKGNPIVFAGKLYKFFVIKMDSQSFRERFSQKPSSASVHTVDCNNPMFHRDTSFMVKFTNHCLLCLL